MLEEALGSALIDSIRWARCRVSGRVGAKTLRSCWEIEPEGTRLLERTNGNFCTTG